jgi:hypothetical protein
MSATDVTAQTLTQLRTAEAERRLEHRRRAAEHRAAARAAARPVGPSRRGLATQLRHALALARAGAAH